MKRQAFTLISLLSLLLVAGSAIAQTTHVRADVPFNFSVGNQTLQAGAYDIETLGASDDKMLLVQARDGNASIIVLSNAAQTLKPSQKTKLVFDQCGSQYFLSEIWIEGATHGRHLPKSSREKELAMESAMGRRPPQVEILASLY